MRGEDGDGLDDSIFFKNEDVESLRNLLVRYIDMNVDEGAERDRVQKLKKLYSWESAAKSTLDVYKKITTICK